jgi:hypothetical protein
MIPYANKVLLKVAHAFLYIDGLLSVAQTVPKPLLSYLLPFPERSIALVKRLVHKGLKWSQPAYANKVLLQVAHAFLYTLMDFFQSHQTVPPLLSYLLPNVQLLSKTTGWFTKGLKLIEPAPLTKCYSGSTFLYTLMDFFQSQTVPKPLLSYLLPFPERSIALVKRLAGSQRAEIDQPYANKVLLR